MLSFFSGGQAGAQQFSLSFDLLRRIWKVVLISGSHKIDHTCNSVMISRGPTWIAETKRKKLNLSVHRCLSITIPPQQKLTC